MGHLGVRSKIVNFGLCTFDEDTDCLSILVWLLLHLKFREHQNTFSRATGVFVESGLISSSDLVVLVENVLEPAFQFSLFDLGNSCENVGPIASSASVLPLHESFWISCVSHNLGKVSIKVLHIYLQKILAGRKVGMC